MNDERDSTVANNAWSLLVNDHYSQTGAYRVEDVLNALGAPWESFQVSAQPSVPFTSSVFSQGDAASNPSTGEKQER